jgi:hypothetical protein
MHKIILFFLLIAFQSNAMEQANHVVQLTERTVSNSEAAAGLEQDKPMPIQYGIVFNMCSSLLQSELFSYEQPECGDFSSGWNYYHQNGHQWNDKVLETMFTYGMLNYYFQNSLGLTVDLNIDSDITKSDKDFTPWAGATLKDKQATYNSLIVFLNLDDTMSDEDKREAAWQAMQRLKFILDDFPRKLPVDIVKIGALYQRYKIVLEKYSALVDYKQLTKLMALLDILQRSIIDFVVNNKTVFQSFVGDSSKKIEHRNGFIVDHEILWSSPQLPDDVKQLLNLPGFVKPFDFRFGDDLTSAKVNEAKARFIHEVEERLKLFEVVRHN